MSLYTFNYTSPIFILFTHKIEQNIFLSLVEVEGLLKAKFIVVLQAQREWCFPALLAEIFQVHSSLVCVT